MGYFAFSNLKEYIVDGKIHTIFKQTECVYLQNLIDSNKNEKISNYHTSL